MGNDADSLKVLREHIAQYHSGDRQGLGRMFALQEELAGMTGQFVMLADCKKSGPSQRRMRSGPLTGDCITFDHVEEESETTLAIALLTGERLRLVTTEDSGLFTGRVATGKPPGGNITVTDAPITFLALQYWILFGSDGGRSEYDDGHVNRRHSVEIVAGGAKIIRWITRCFSDRIPHHHKREWLTFVVKLMRAAGNEGDAGSVIQDESAWIDCLQCLGYCENMLLMRGVSANTISTAKAELRELLARAEALGHGDDPYVLDLKGLYPDLV